MSIVYDNWERLVDATLKREQFRQLAREPSLSSSLSTTTSFNSSFNFQSDSSIDYQPGSLIYQVIKAAEDAAIFRRECAGIKSKAEKLSVVLRRAAGPINGVYDRPTRRIMLNTEQVLEEALALLQKCSRQGIMRVFNIMTPATAFGKVSAQLENSTRDVSWLLSIAASGGEEYRGGVPPIAASDPLLCLIWEQIVILHVGSLQDRSDAAAVLEFLARENDESSKLIIEEGGVRPLLKLVQEGEREGQENAAKAIGWLGKDVGNVERMIDEGACEVLVKMLKQGPMSVQAAVAWAVAELTVHHHRFQHLFAQHNIIWLLGIHLAFESSLLLTVSPIAVTRQLEDPTTKAHLKAMAARALCHLAKGNSLICRRITELRTLRTLAALLEEGPEEVQYHSAMALVEITAVAEVNAELRKSGFNPNSHVCRTVVDQLLRIVETGTDSKLLIPCIKAIGNLARIFTINQMTSIISPLVKSLYETDAEVCREVCVALAKFVGSENFLNQEYSKGIIGAGGVKRLVELVHSGEEIVKSCALVLLCCIALNVPSSEQLDQERVPDVLEWASKQSSLTRVEDLEELLPKAMQILEFYEHRTHRWSIGRSLN